MTGLPAALSALALASTASVADSEIAAMRAETRVGMRPMLARGGDTVDPPGSPRTRGSGSTRGRLARTLLGSAAVLPLRQRARVRAAGFAEEAAWQKRCRVNC